MRVAATLLAGLLLPCACVAPRRQAVAPPPAGATPGALVPPAPDRVDLSRLRGRRIVLDPGHGGEFAGAVASSGDSEAEWNVAVGLELEQRLVSAGARAILTRSHDGQLAHARSRLASLQADLAARSAAAADGCDLFVSIHHNASESRRKVSEQVVVFYRLMDGGEESASAVAGRRILEAFERAFQPRHARLLPANFRVLRETDAPAVLCEPFFLQRPGKRAIEDRHALVRREAECYLAGIAAYFDAGVPEVTSFVPSGSPAREARPELVFEVADSAGAGIDPGSFSAELDGKRLPRQAMTVSVLPHGAVRAGIRPPAPLANGPHEVRLRCRNLRGNPLYARRWAFDVACPAATLTVSAEPAVAWDSPGRRTRHAVRAAVRLADAAGRPVTDGTDALFSVAGRAETASARTRAGEAEADLWFDSDPAGPVTVVARSGGLRASCTAPDASASDRFLRGIVLDRATGAPVAGAELAPAGTAPSADGPTKTSRFGSFRLPVATEAGAIGGLSVRAHGFAPKTVEVPRNAIGRRVVVHLSPLFGGALRGRPVAVERAWRGGAAMRTEADAFAAVVAGRLREAGADVFRLDRGDRLERIREATRRGTQLFVRAAREGGSAAKVRVGRHPEAPAGARLAARIARAVREDGEFAVKVHGVSDDLFLHLPCPAVELRAVGTRFEPESMDALVRRAVEACALHLAAAEPPRAPGEEEPDE